MLWEPLRRELVDWRWLEAPAEQEVAMARASALE